MIDCFLTMSYLEALLHSLVDGLRIQHRCYQKEGVTLRPQHLRAQTTWLEVFQKGDLSFKEHKEVRSNSIATLHSLSSGCSLDCSSYSLYLTQSNKNYKVWFSSFSTFMIWIGNLGTQTGWSITTLNSPIIVGGNLAWATLIFLLKWNYCKLKTLGLPLSLHKDFQPTRWILVVRQN